jgi:transcriptional regulator GlxA family with amidase domain
MTDRPKAPAGAAPATRRFVFLTLPNYTMIALASAVDALRMANRVAPREAYTWSLATLDGKPASASNGLQMAPTWRWSTPERPTSCLWSVVCRSRKPSRPGC